MIILRPNPSQVILQTLAQNLDGTPKTTLSDADVRVYHIDATGTEIEDLASTTLSQVGSTNTWRYRWEPLSLSVNRYQAEYTLLDLDGATMVGVEELVVEDFAIQADLLVVKQVETGKWKIINNQMIFYEEDNTTEIFRCNLFNSAGLPAMEDIYERERV